MPDDQPRSELRVFFSWQSDLPAGHCTNFIRSALKKAARSIEQKHKGMQVVLDEATRATPGSPDIFATILEKISTADVFVCDISMVGTKSGIPLEAMPNPNVMAEFGYALAEIGYERMILLCNTSYTSIPADLPFDIDRRRVTPFVHEEVGHASSELETRLIVNLTDALRAILERNPRKARLRYLQSPEHARKEQDTALLIECLSRVHGPSLIDYCTHLPGRFDQRLLWFHDSFVEWVDLKTHQLHDQVLVTKLVQVAESWSRTLAYPNEYDGRGHYAMFVSNMDLPLPPERQLAWDSINVASNALRENWIGLTVYVKSNYLELSLDKLSKLALQRHEDAIKEATPRKATLMKKFQTWFVRNIVP